MKGLVVLVLGVLALSQCGDAKVLRGELVLDGEVPEHYINKFSINGDGHVIGSLETVTGERFTTGSVTLFLFDAEDWPQYLEEVTCMDRARLAKHRFSIGHSGTRELTEDEELRATYQLSSHEGKFGFSQDIKLEEGSVWYVVIADCSLEQIYHQIPPIKYEVTLKNGLSHIPAEEYGLEWVYTILLVVLVVAGIKGFMLVGERRASLGSLHLIMKLLVVAYLFNVLATVCECAHLWIYSYTGEAAPALNRASEIMQAIFAAVVNFVMLALACGWTLTETGSQSGTQFMQVFRNPSAMFEWTDVGFMAIPAVLATPSSLLVLIFMTSFIVVETYDVFSTNRDDDFAKFHSHDSDAGSLLMLMQVLFLGLFLFSLSKTMKTVSERLKMFCKQLIAAGTLWFLVTPVLVLVAPMFPKVLRHRLVTSGTIMLQSTALLVMCRLFLTSSSDYFKFSALAESGTLLGLGGGSTGRPSGKVLD